MAAATGAKMTIPDFRQSPREPGFVQDPYPFYDRVRAATPLFHWSDYNHLCTAHFDLTNTILRDRRFGRVAPDGFKTPVPKHLEPFYHVESFSLLDREPPDHTRLRMLVLRAFTSRRIAELEPEIAALAERLMDEFDGTDIDLLPIFAEKIPVIIIARLLGVPESLADQLLIWSHDMVSMYQARRDRSVEDRAVKSALEFRDFLTGYIAERRARPADDLITHLIAAEADGAKLSTAELISTCVLLLNAGHEATVHAIGNGVRAILKSGQMPGDLLTTPKTTLATANEILRYDPPLHMFTRYATQDVEIGGHSFKIGDVVGLLLAAANRDPARYANPAKFDIQRGGTGQLAFGAGIHFCVGAPLALLEMTTALPALFRRFPNLHLADEPNFADRYHFHGLENLRLKLV